MMTNRPQGDNKAATAEHCQTDLDAFARALIATLRTMVEDYPSAAPGVTATVRLAATFHGAELDGVDLVTENLAHLNTLITNELKTFQAAHPGQSGECGHCGGSGLAGPHAA